MKIRVMTAVRLCVLFAVAATGCHQSNNARGSVLIGLQTAALATDPIELITVTVRGADIEPSISVPLQGDPMQGWSGTIEGIRAGADRIFLAQAYNDQASLIYSGTAENVRIVAGQTTQLIIVLQPLDRPEPFENAVPRFESIVLSDSQVAPGEQVTIVASASDPDLEPLVYTWSATGGSFSDPSQSETIWSAPEVEGDVELTIQVTDTKNATAELSFGIEVSAANAVGDAEVDIDVNTWPEILNLVSQPARIDVGEVTQLNLTAVDQDGDPLTYQWIADCEGGFNDTAIEDPSFVLLADNGGLDCKLSVTLTDLRGRQNNASIAIATGAAIEPETEDPTEPNVVAIRDYYLFKEDGSVEPGGYWYDYPAFGPDGEEGIYRYGIEKTCAWTGARNRPYYEDGKRSINMVATAASDHQGNPIEWHLNGFRHVVPALNLESVTNLVFDLKVAPGFQGTLIIRMENGVYHSSYFPGGYPIDPTHSLEGGGFQPIYPYWFHSVDTAEYGFDKHQTDWQTITIPVQQAFGTIDVREVRSPFVIELTEVGDKVSVTNIRFENYTEYASNTHRYRVQGGTDQEVRDKYADQGYDLVWNDEFHGNQINPEYWHVTKNGKVDEVTGLSGYGNDEWQSYNEENVLVENGLLKIISRFEPSRYNGPDYGVIPPEDIHQEGDRDSQFTSGRIFSKKKKEFKYGIIEASISLPFAPGAVDPGYWPAFWILGSRIQEIAWPMCGEIDIMERGGKRPDTLFATCHFGDSWEAWTYNRPDNYVTSHSGGGLEQIWGDGFHTYTLEWTAQSLKWYFDSELVLEFSDQLHRDRGYGPVHPQYGAAPTENPMRFFQDDFYIVINAAVGVSNPDNDCAAQADYRNYQQDKIMLVDWVRVYQRND